MCLYCRYLSHTIFMPLTTIPHLQKARDQEAKAKANEKLLGDGGAAKESEKGGDGGDDNAGGDAGEEEERAMEEAAEAAAAGRKPSKYRRAKKDN